MFPAHTLTANAKYTDAYESIRTTFSKLGIVTAKKTHWGRVFMVNRLVRAG